MSQYSTGTVTVTNGSATVVGVGTSWGSGVGMAVGDLFIVPGDNVSYEIAAITDTTHIDLAANYAGVTASGASYVVHSSFTPFYDIPYPEQGDVETATIMKRAMTTVESSLLTSQYNFLTVLDRDLTAPPGSPSEGDTYIVGASATGDWATHDGEIAVYASAAWTFTTPAEGWRAFIADEDIELVHINGAWSDTFLGTIDSLNISGALDVGGATSVTTLNVSSTFDVTNTGLTSATTYANVVARLASNAAGGDCTITMTDNVAWQSKISAKSKVFSFAPDGTNTQFTLSETAATFAGTLAAGATTLTGNSTVQKANPIFTIESTTSADAILSLKNTTDEWQAYITGSDFRLWNGSDLFTMTSAGAATFAGTLASGNHSITNGTVGLYLGLTGGVPYIQGYDSGGGATNRLDLYGGSLVALSLDGSQNATFAKQISAGNGQFTGSGFPSSGAGIELQYTGGEARVLGYNRTGSAWLPLRFDGSTLSLRIAGNEALGIDASKNATFAGKVLGKYTSTTSVAFAPDSGAPLTGLGGGSSNIGRLIANSVNIATFAEAGFVVTKPFDISGASAGQIKFPATQNASADANTLDDYEEGTWTPTISPASGSTHTYTAQVGTYTKIGNRVFIQGYININTVGDASGAIKISGLPYTSSSTTQNYSSVDVSWGAGLSLGAAGQSIGGYVEFGATTIYLSIWGSTAGSTDMQMSELSTGSIIFSAFYSV